MLPRSPEGVIALLAILTAGAAYLPLDEAYPADRLKFMLQDCGASIVITDKTRSALPALGWRALDSRRRAERVRRAPLCIVPD